MRDLRLLGLTLAAMAVLPGLAAATHFDEVIVVGDCEGWSAEVNVTWRTGIYTGDLNYSIRLVDQNANILEQIDWAGVIDREVSDPRQMSTTSLAPGAAPTADRSSPWWACSISWRRTLVESMTTPPTSRRRSSAPWQPRTRPGARSRRFTADRCRRGIGDARNETRTDGGESPSVLFG